MRVKLEDTISPYIETPRLHIHPASSVRRLDEIKILLDGEAVGTAAWGDPVPQGGPGYPVTSQPFC